MTDNISLSAYVQQYITTNAGNNVLPSNTLPQPYALALQAIEQWIDNKIGTSGTGS